MITLSFGVLVLLYTCTNGIEPGCGNCGCCTNKECSREYVQGVYVDQYCTNGCIAGIGGNKCYNKCANDCLTCNRTHAQNCATCDYMKYINDAQRCVDCPKNCKKCTSAVQCQECFSPYYNDGSKQDCSLSCPRNCLCEILGVCSSCEDGFYNVGNTCRNACPDTCKTCFDQSNCQSCKPSYSGNICCVKNGHCHKCSSSTVCEKCSDGYYGVQCERTCPDKCETSLCKRENGNCLSCQDGYYGEKCGKSCPDKCQQLQCERNTGICLRCDMGLYGNNCTQNCSKTCFKKRCNKQTGHCSEGCIVGYTGANCTEVSITDPNEQKGSNNTGATAGGVIGGIVAVVVVVVVIIIIVRRRHPKRMLNLFTYLCSRLRINNIKENNVQKNTKLPGNSKLSLIPNDELEEIVEEGDDVTDGEDLVYENIPSVAFSGLEAYVRSKKEEDFSNEFGKLPKGLTQSYNDAKKPENAVFNRYKGMYPYDHSRVKLKSDPDFFINACYIDGYKRPNGYIASLGPIAKATKEYYTFWRMVWHKKADIIVMLTNLIEPSGNKCEQYWPDLKCTNTHEDYTVSCQLIEEFVEYTLRTVTIEKPLTSLLNAKKDDLDIVSIDKEVMQIFICFLLNTFQNKTLSIQITLYTLPNSEKRTVYQLHYTAWPDKSIPDEVTSLVEFRERVRSTPRPNQGPVIVHCSAGVGRTGTYIALDRLTETGEAGERINVYECVYQMRTQRLNMVQTLEQYEYIHKALVHTLTFGCAAVRAEEFGEHVRNTSDAQIRKNFNLSIDVIDEDSAEEVQARATNGRLKNKNRKRSDIPGDRHRPMLYLGRSFDDSNYINAMNVNGFKRKNQFIIAQSPLNDTVADFLCLIYQENCCCIVSMEDENLIGKEIGAYLGTDNQELKYGNFTVKASLCESKENYTIKKLTIKNKDKHSGGKKELHHHQLNCWKKNDVVPSDLKEFTQFVKDIVNKADEPDNESSPILVHCLNGAYRSGLFCAVGILLEKIDVEGQVSVPNTVRRLRTRRRMAIPNKDQFEFCYHSVGTYLDSSSMYCNFSN